MQVKESILRDILRLIVWFPFRWFLRIVPINFALFTIKTLGICHFHIAKKKKQMLLDTISKTLNISKSQGITIVKKYFEIHYLDRLHIFLYPRLTSSNIITDYVRVENIQLLNEARRLKNGVLIVQPHFGPVQLTLLELALKGYLPMQIGFPTDKHLSKIGRKVAFKYRVKYEKMLPAPIIAADRFIGKAYRHLKKGGIVFTTGDGAGRGVCLGEHKMMNFLGKKRNIPLGPASLAIKTKAIFVPAFIIPESYNLFRIVFEEPILPKYNDLSKDKIYITEKFLGVTETYIKTYPHCWHFWDEL